MKAALFSPSKSNFIAVVLLSSAPFLQIFIANPLIYNACFSRDFGVFRYKFIDVSFNKYFWIVLGTPGTRHISNFHFAVFFIAMLFPMEARVRLRNSRIFASTQVYMVVSYSGVVFGFSVCLAWKWWIMDLLCFVRVFKEICERAWFAIIICKCDTVLMRNWYVSEK